jgi:protein-S-isoprenylcysteine O-methyltransferase Ste14
MRAPAPTNTRAADAGAEASAPTTRGGWWVVGQVAIILMLVASSGWGSSWPARLRLPAYLVSAALLSLGLSLLLGGAFQLGASLTPFPRPRARGRLITSGSYRLARHPMYGGGILIALGWSALFASALGIALTAVLTLFLELKSRREEAWLVERYAEYDEYRRRIRRKLVPFVY